MDQQQRMKLFVGSRSRTPRCSSSETLFSSRHPTPEPSWLDVTIRHIQAQRYHALALDTDYQLASGYLFRATYLAKSTKPGRRKCFPANSRGGCLPISVVQGKTSRRGMLAFTQSLRAPTRTPSCSSSGSPASGSVAGQKSQPEKSRGLVCRRPVYRTRARQGGGFNYIISSSSRTATFAGLPSLRLRSSAKITASARSRIERRNLLLSFRSRR